MPKIKENYWKQGEPDQVGWYVIAVLYENGLGYEACDYWDTEHKRWNMHQDDNVIGYIPLQTVLKTANIAFPEHLVE